MTDIEPIQSVQDTQHIQEQQATSTIPQQYSPDSKLNAHDTIYQHNPQSLSPAEKSAPIKQQSAKQPSQSNNIQQDLEQYFQKFNVLQTKPSASALMQNTNKTTATAASVSTPIKSPNNKKQQQLNVSTAMPIQNSQGKLTEADSNLDEEELYRYCQLSSKLNNALSRIQGSKITQKSQEQNNMEDMFKRFDYYEKKRKDEIQRRAKELEQEKLKEFKGRPTLSKGTLIMTQKISNEPIYERYERTLETKEKKLQEQRERKKKQEEEQFEKYLKEFEEHNPKPEKSRTAEQFYEELLRWKQKKEEKVKEKKEQEKNKEIEGATFKPIINDRSKKLLAKAPRQPIHEREPKPPKPIIQEQCTFKPKINKRANKT